MYELKTKLNKLSVDRFLKSIPDEAKRQDSIAIVKLMQQITNEEPKMWGSSILGFGSYHYVYDTGHEGDMCMVGFSPRKQTLTLYVMADFEGRDELLKKLGKHKSSKACLYINRLDDVHLPTLKKLIQHAFKYMTKTYK